MHGERGSRLALARSRSWLPPRASKHGLVGLSVVSARFSKGRTTSTYVSLARHRSDLTGPGKHGDSATGEPEELCDLGKLGSRYGRKLREVETSDCIQEVRTGVPTSTAPEAEIARWTAGRKGASRDVGATVVTLRVHVEIMSTKWRFEVGRDSAGGR